MRLNGWLITLAGAAVTSSIAVAQQPAAGIQDGQIIRTAAATVRVSAIRGFVYPWALAFLPNGDMLVTEQGRNTLRLVRNGVLDPTPITGLPQGITSTRRDTAGVDVAVHPRFAENRYLYVAYWKPSTSLGPGPAAGTDATARGANIRTAVLVRARYDGSPALTDVREIFTSISWTDGPSAARLVFGRDGKIYLAIGAPGFADERGATSWAQAPAEHGGKILRLNDDGTSAAGNRFASPVFSFGHRNPQGLAWHPTTRDLWETEHGNVGNDEINVIESGGNYGWPVIEGDETRPDMRAPIEFFAPSVAPSGADFYTGPGISGFRNQLFVATLKATALVRVVIDGSTSRHVAYTERLLEGIYGRLRDVVMGPDGYLYISTSNRDGRTTPVAEDDRLIRIVPVR